KLDTSKLAVGQYQTELMIEGEGLPQTSCVLISYEVAALDVSVSPKSIDLGTIAVGGRAIAPVTISNSGRGSSPAKARLETTIPGVTFPKKFVVDRNLQINVELDALAISPGKYASALVIEGAGLPRTFRIPLSFQVKGLEVKFD